MRRLKNRSGGVISMIANCVKWSATKRLVWSFIFALKEGEVASLFCAMKVEEKRAIKNGSSFGDIKDKALILSQPSVALSRVVQVMLATSSLIGEPRTIV